MESRETQYANKAAFDAAYRMMKERMHAMILNTTNTNVKFEEGKEWAMNPRTNVITYPTTGPSSIFTISKVQALSLLLHELGHANFSSAVAPETLPNPPMIFGLLLNALEDLRIERRMMARHHGTYDSFKGSIDTFIDRVDVANVPEAHHAALLNLFLKEWMQPYQIPEGRQDIEEFLKKMWPTISGNLLKMKTSQELLNFAAKTVWPEFEKLLPPQDQNDQQEGDGEAPNQPQDKPEEPQKDNSPKPQPEPPQTKPQGQEGAPQPPKPDPMDMKQLVENSLNEKPPEEPNDQQEGQGQPTPQDADGNPQPEDGSSDGQSQKPWIGEIQVEMRHEAERQEEEQRKAKANVKLPGDGPRYSTNKPTYEELLSEMRTPITFLKRKLGSILEDNKLSRFGGSFTSGKLNHSKLYRFKTNQTNLFGRKIARQNKDYRVSLLVDISGSMGGQKIHETAKGAILLAEVLNIIGVEFEIVGFNTKLVEYKTFDQPFNWTARRNMEWIIPSAWMEGSGSTSDGIALYRTLQQVKQRPKAKNIVILLTDGGSNPSYNSIPPEFTKIMPVKDRGRYNNIDDFNIHTELKKLEEHAFVTGIGIMDTDVRGIYQRHAIVNEARDIPNAILSPIRHFIRRG